MLEAGTDVTEESAIYRINGPSVVAQVIEGAAVGRNVRGAEARARPTSCGAPGTSLMLGPIVPLSFEQFLEPRTSLPASTRIESLTRLERAGVERVFPDGVLLKKRLHAANTSLTTPCNSERLLAVLLSTFVTPLAGAEQCARSW